MRRKEDEAEVWEAGVTIGEEKGFKENEETSEDKIK